MCEKTTHKEPTIYYFGNDAVKLTVNGVSVKGCLGLVACSIISEKRALAALPEGYVFAEEAHLTAFADAYPSVVSCGEILGLGKMTGENGYTIHSLAPSRKISPITFTQSEPIYIAATTVVLLIEE